MGRKRHTPEQIITALREAEVGLARGKSVKLISRELGITEQTYYRWRREYGGIKVSQARSCLVMSYLRANCDPRAGGGPRGPHQPNLLIRDCPRTLEVPPPPPAF